MIAIMSRRQLLPSSGLIRSDQDESCEDLEALVTLKPGSSGRLFCDGLGGHC